MRWWRRVTTASYGQLWLLPVWGLCLGRGSVAMFKQKAASDPSERVSARTQQCQQSRAAQCRRASPLPRTMPSSGKRNLVVPRCCGQGGSQRQRSPCLHSPYHHGHHPRRGGPSLSPSLIIDLTSCASSPLLAGHSGTWAPGPGYCSLYIRQGPDFYTSSNTTLPHFTLPWPSTGPG